MRPPTVLPTSSRARHGRIARGVVAGVVVALTVLGTAPVVSAGEGADSVTDADRALAERFVPVVMLQTQPEACSLDGEPFIPMSVDAVLDNPEVALRQQGPDGLVALWGPTASDLFRYGPNFYLDFPGASLEPGCAYERDMHRYLDERGLGPLVYAHVMVAPDDPGVIALQYWFYFYYNDWNNKHESDWEGIQLLFRADSAEEALATEPYSVGYAQHTGGERADWTDAKLQRDGDRPVVYTSARSHASYYSDSFFLGRGASEGFGCDDTTAPSTRVDPEVVVLPDSVSSADDPYAWLAFQGRWGERHAGAYDSPTGLVSKYRWTNPVAWDAQLRDGSVTVPVGDTAAGEVIDAFCRVVQWGSGQALLVQLSPVRVLVTLVVLVIAVRFLLGRTSWTPTTPRPIVRRRRAGQILRTALDRFRRDPATYLGLGLLAIPVIAIVSALVGIARAIPVVGALLDLSDTGGSSRVVMSAVTGGIASSIAFVFVVAAVAHVLSRDDEGHDASASEAVAAVRSHASALTVTILIAIATIAILGSTVLLAPVAGYLVVRWQLAAPVVALEGRSGRAALLRSRRLTRRRWWHTLLVTGAINLVVIGSGLLAALVVLTLFSSLPLWSTTIVAALVEAVVLPIGAIALTLLYGDARAQDDARVAEATSDDDSGESTTGGAGAPTAAAGSPSR